MDPDQRAHHVLSLFDEPSVRVARGTLGWVPVRRRLGIGAFGTNAFRAARKGDVVIEAHVESPGQEELYVVVAGRAQFTIGEHQVDAPAGTVVFVPRPDQRRGGIALEDRTVVLAIGGWREEPYHSLPWEPIYLAQESTQEGDWAAAAEILQRESEQHLDTAIVQFRLACCHAQLGEHKTALRELRRAIEIDPAMRDRAASEEHLAPLRELQGWDAVVESGSGGRTRPGRHERPRREQASQ